MERIKKTLGERPLSDVGSSTPDFLRTLRAVLELAAFPILKQCRDILNGMAPSGTVTITGADTTADVTFDSAEPDASYLVTVTCQGTSGSPAAGATLPWVESRTTMGFTVTVGTAPGGGAMVTVGWSIRR